MLPTRSPRRVAAPPWSLSPAQRPKRARLSSSDIVGGFDENALRVYWTSNEGAAPRWIALKTFMGSQLKYVMPDKQPPLVFALGDEDAYAYCDEDPCVCCTFHCKRGFEIYAYVDGIGLVSMPIHREDLLG